MACNELAASAAFLENVNDDNTELTMLKASCLFSLKKYDSCLTAAAALLKMQPDNPEALYLAAISALQVKKTTNSIQYAIALAKLVLKAGDPLETESLLYPYLLRFTINDVNGGYTTEAYNTLTAEDLALLKSNEFLYNYVTAAHLWATNNADNRMAALTLLDKVLASKKNLSRALYIKGALYHEQQDNEKSLACLKASLALDEEQPTVWYTLATLYDRMQKYEEAYAACKKVLDYLPATDHASDVFGLSPHASALMDKLRPYIKVGD
jgi:tetratricopeptide (TPR) repeat protein